MPKLTPDYNRANACNILLAILSPHITGLTVLLVNFARENVGIQVWILVFWVMMITTFLITVGVRFYYFEGMNNHRKEVRL